MYNDYDVVYKSNLNEHFMLMTIFGILGILLLILTIFSLSKVYKKANRSGIAPWIPIYNMYLLVEIANLPILYFILLLIPIANIYAMYKISLSIAMLFKKNKIFGIGLFILPFIFYPILAFSDSEYVGINLFALQGTTTVEDIPIIDENKNQEIEVKVNDNYDVSSRNINISIGGGRYQKDYVSNLTDVDKEKVLNKAQVELENKRKSTGMFINNERFEEIANNATMLEEKKESSDIFSVPFINNEEAKVEENNISNNVNTINSVAPPKENATPKNNEYNLCPNCKTRVSAGAKVCFICGQPLE